MFRHVAIVDTVLESIDEHVAAHPPERGGGLLGPLGLPLITSFVPDPDASATGVTFRTSPAFQHTLNRIEMADPDVELKGIVHSHPGGMNRPSGGDEVAFADSLRLAPWLGRFVNPIVTGRNRRAEAHEVLLPHGLMSVFVSELDPRGGVEIRPAQVQILPIGRDTTRLASALGAQPSAPTTVDVDGIVYLSVVMSMTGLEVKLLFPAMYPFQAPIVLAERNGELSGDATALLDRFHGRTRSDRIVPLPIAWDLTIPEESRLEHAVRARPGAPVRVTSEPAVGPANSEPDGLARTGIRARLDGVVSDRLAGRRVLLVGAGSGGSRTADALIRSGVENIVVLDPDEVAVENLSRSVYQLCDVGLPKVHALARHLRAINPQLGYASQQVALQALSAQQIDELVRGVDLVVAATDDPDAQRTLDHFAYWNKIPAVFGGVYAKGHAGEVVFTVPEITRCYRCSTTSRHQDDQQIRRVDYGTGRLRGEPALGADIDHVVSASVKIALGLLQLEDDTESSARDLVYGALASGYNYLILSTVARYGFLADIFGDVPGQHAYQSAWLSVEGVRDCTVCGTSRIDPSAVTRTAPRVEALQVREVSN